MVSSLGSSAFPMPLSKELSTTYARGVYEEALNLKKRKASGEKIHVFEMENLERVQEFTLHYLLALDQSDDVICSYIQKKINSGKTKVLSSQDPEFLKMTPLMIATLKGRTKVVKLLLDYWKTLFVEEGSPALRTRINQKNENGWSAYHISVLTSPQIYSMLRAHGGDDTAKNCLGGTVEDIRTMVLQNPPKPFTHERVLWKEDDKPETVLISDLITKDRLFAVTGLRTYTDSTHVLPRNFDKLLQTKNDCPVSQLHFCQPLCSKLASSDDRYKFVIGNHPKLLDQNGIYVKGITAYQDTPFLTPLGVFSGEWLSDDRTVHGGEQVSFKKFGSFTRWINFGFPNVTSLAFYDEGGYKSVVVVSEQDGIKELEEVLMSYNFMNIFDNNYVILGASRLEEFFSGKGSPEEIEHTLASVRASAQDSAVHVKYLDLTNKLQYLFTLPSTFFYLHFKDVVTASQWLMFFKKPQLPQEFEDFKNNIKPYAGFERIISALELMDFLNTMLEDYPEEHELISNWVIGNIGKLNFMQIYDVLDKIAEDAKTQLKASLTTDSRADYAPFTTDSWAAYIDKLDPHTDSKEIWRKKHHEMSLGPSSP